jgi:hypothetical protein
VGWENLAVGRKVRERGAKISDHVVRVPCGFRG